MRAGAAPTTGARVGAGFLAAVDVVYSTSPCLIAYRINSEL